MVIKHNCPAKYKNIGTQSFGDRKKVTDEMLKQFCMNDAYLYKRVIELLDLTDPETRKRFYINRDENNTLQHFKDFHNSFGFDDGETLYWDCGTEKLVNNYQFDNSTHKELTINLSDINSPYLDLERSTAELSTYIDPETKQNITGVHIPPNEFENVSMETETVTINVPKQVTETKREYKSVTTDASYDGPYGGFAPNGTWSVCFGWNSKYSIKSSYKQITKNGKTSSDKYYTSEKIPTQCLAQTFKAQKTGRLYSVTLNMKADKKVPYPLIVEIWKTNSQGYPVADTSAKGYVKGYPATGCLARSIKTVTHTGMALESFKFTSACDLKKGQSYAIVLRSPLVNKNCCYHIAGWQTMCYNSNAKKDYNNNKSIGHPFTSLNNGKTWKQYNKDSCGYSSASKNPKAFGFEIKTRPYSETKYTTQTTGKTTTEIEKMVFKDFVEYTVGIPFYLYFKPIRTNPLIGVTLAYNHGTNVKFQIFNNWADSSDPTYATWVDLNNNATKEMNPNHPTVLMIRAILTTNDSDESPVLSDNLTIDLHTEPATEGYLLSNAYAPNRDEMLPACIWAEFNSNYILDSPNVNIGIDIVNTSEVTDMFRFVEVKPNSQLATFISEFNPSVETNTVEKIKNYLKTNINEQDSSFFKFLKNQSPPVYVLGTNEFITYGTELTPTYLNLKKYISDYCEYIGDKNYGSFVVDDRTTEIFMELDKNSKNQEFAQYLSNLIPPVYVIGYDENVRPINSNGDELSETITKPYFDSLTLSHYPSYCVEDVKNNILCTAPLEDVQISSNELAFIHTSEENDNSGIIDKSTLRYGCAYEYSVEDDSAEPKLYISQIITDVNNYSDAENRFKPAHFELKSYNSNTKIAVYTRELVMYVDDSTSYDYKYDDGFLEINATANSAIVHNYLKFEGNVETDNYEFVGFKTPSSISGHNTYYQLELGNFAECDLHEHVDYELNYFDYTDEGKQLTFKPNILNKLKEGTFTITYYPTWLRGLKEDNFPLRLDLWKEEFMVFNDEFKQSPYASKVIYSVEDDVVNNLEYTITDSWAFEEGNTVIKTTVNPVDNLRRVTINEDTDSEVDLVEDRDFVVDYENNKIVFNNHNFIDGDRITVRYTPNLTDTSLKIAYRVSRVRGNLENPHIMSYYLTTRT